MGNTKIQYQARCKISHLILEHAIYSIILIGVHRAADPFLFYFIEHFQHSYQRDYCLYLVDFITCLQVVRGDHRVFVITVQNCK